MSLWKPRPRRRFEPVVDRAGQAVVLCAYALVFILSFTATLMFILRAIFPGLLDVVCIGFAGAFILRCPQVFYSRKEIDEITDARNAFVEELEARLRDPR